jgi:hypothetical protein
MENTSWESLVEYIERFCKKNELVNVAKKENEMMGHQW